MRLVPCEVPGCDREATEARPQSSGDIVYVCGQPHVTTDSEPRRALTDIELHDLGGADKASCPDTGEAPT